MSNEYFARPETLNGPSMRDMRLPIKLRFSASGHLYSGIVMPSFCYLHDRGANTHVGATATEVAAQPGPQLFGSWVGVFVEKSFASDNKAGSAEAALLPIVVDERLLDWMQFVAIHQSLNRSDLLSLRFNRQHCAGVNGLAVNDHGAGTARGAIANTLGAGQFQFVAQRVEQRH